MAKLRRKLKRLLEAFVRGILIYYNFFVSDRNNIEVVGPKRVLNLITPTVFRGRGRIRIAPTAVFGVVDSFYSYRCGYIEARTATSLIEIGENTTINNGASLCSEGAAIRIGARCLIGPGLSVLDANMHETQPDRRLLPDNNPRQVVIGDDVFVGMHVTILKGTRIGNGSVITAGAVVMGLLVPPLSIVAGNPARVVGRVPTETVTVPTNEQGADGTASGALPG